MLTRGSWQEDSTDIVPLLVGFGFVAVFVGTWIVWQRAQVARRRRAEGAVWVAWCLVRERPDMPGPVAWSVHDATKPWHNALLLVVGDRLVLRPMHAMGSGTRTDRYAWSWPIAEVDCLESPRRSRIQVSRVIRYVVATPDGVLEFGTLREAGAPPFELTTVTPAPRGG